MESVDSEVVVDPAHFRLLAFLVDWVEPLEKIQGDPLADLLLLEARMWITEGIESGVFRGEERPKESGYLAEWANEAFLGTILGWMREWEPRDFSRALMTAQEDLSEERKEFLGLVLFSDDETWEGRLLELQVFTKTLTNNPLSPFEDDYMDRLGWALDGPESLIRSEDKPSPARWRGADLPIQKVMPTVSLRLEALAKVRRSILEVFQGEEFGGAVRTI